MTYDDGFLWFWRVSNPNWEIPRQFFEVRQMGENCKTNWRKAIKFNELTNRKLLVLVAK